MKELKERFKAFIEARPDDCVIWTGLTDRDGYGLVKVNGKLRPLHRVIYVDVMGNAPPLVVRHTCHNRACGNRHHLIGGTARDNVKDMVTAGRQAKGKRVHTAKLKAEQVKRIKERGKTEHKASLAIEFACSVRAIDKIISGATWRHVNV